MRLPPSGCGAAAPAPAPRAAASGMLRGARLQISGLSVVRTLTCISGTHLLVSSSSSDLVSQVAADAHAASRPSANFGFFAAGGMATKRAATRSGDRSAGGGDRSAGSGDRSTGTGGRV